MNDTQLFEFENDFVATLRCVPMAVRFKLDRCGIKLSLRQWSRLTPADRHDLLLAPCEAPADIEAYRHRLRDLVALRTDSVAKPLPEPPDPSWAQAARTPATVSAFAHSVDVPPPTDAEWAGLSQLQRFTLLKLSRDNHDNVNFIPALREFGLARGTPRSVADPQDGG